MVDRIEDLASSFARHLRAEGASDRTIVLYRPGVTQCCRWLVEHDREAVLSEIRRAAIREWLAELSETREAGTVKLRYRASWSRAPWQPDDCVPAWFVIQLTNVLGSTASLGVIRQFADGDAVSVMGYAGTRGVAGDGKDACDHHLRGTGSA